MLVQDERLVRRVGAVSLALLGLAIAFFVFVYDRIEWSSHVRVHVYFHHVGSLREGGAFVVGGRQIGTIETIALAPRGESGPLGGDEGVVVTVAIDASRAAMLDRRGDVFVASRGALSERYLELGPPPLECRRCSAAPRGRAAARALIRRASIACCSGPGTT